MTDGPEDDGYGDGEDPDSVTDKQLADLIDGWLDDARPERYNDDDVEWQESVIDQTALAILQYQDPQTAIRDAAKRRVRQREGQAVKHTQAELRKIATTGQLPLGWGDGDDWMNGEFFHHLLRLPLKINGVKVRWGAMSPDDWRDWELENSREGDEDQARRIEARRGARLFHDWAEAQGVQRTEDLRPPEPPS